MCRAGKKRKGRGFGTCILSEPLAKFMGAERAPRTEVYCSCCANHEVAMSLPWRLSPSVAFDSPFAVLSQILIGQNLAQWLHMLNIASVQIMLCPFAVERQAIAECSGCEQNQRKLHACE